ncbi:glycosyltransferase [Streptomyces violascens]|uniref:glycosyltransferase n=1 Tax=Streptomyces violascens TaxID=67381 RepID=UPI0036C3B0FC
MNFIWFGGAIQEHALANIVQWADKAGADWRITLWVDRGARESNGDRISHLRSLGVHVEEFSEDMFGGYKKARALFLFALEHKAYAMASDLTRYAILLTRGGIYSDVDIAPGEAFPVPDTARYDLDSIPAFAPMIRDGKHLKSLIPQALQDEKDRGAAATPLKGDAEYVDLVADYQLSRLQFGNHFIAAPAGLDFLKFLLDSTPDLNDPLEQLKYEVWAKNGGSELRQNAAAVTGPGKITRLMQEYARKVKGSERFGPLTPEEAIAVFGPRPFALARTIGTKGIQWLTPESENQEH